MTIGLYECAWIVWIAGTILIVLSWNGTVSPRTGWVGFGIALFGVVLSFVPHLRRKLPGSQASEDWAVLSNAILEGKDRGYEIAMERFQQGGTLIYEGMAVSLTSHDEITCAVVASRRVAELDEIRVREEVDRAKRALEALTSRSPELAAAAQPRTLRVSLISESGAKGVEICRVAEDKIDWKVKSAPR